MRTTFRRDCRGFSVTELLVVLGLAGILLLITMPALGNWLRSNRVRAAASQLVTHIRLTRHAAIAAGDGVAELDVATDQRSYSYPDGRGATRVQTLPEGVSLIAASPDPLMFRANGTLDGVNSGSLQVEGPVASGIAHRYTIALNRIGKISVTREEVTP